MANEVDMRAHKVRVVVSESHEVSVRLPSDFPRGEAELTIVAEGDAPAAREPLSGWLERLLAKIPEGPGLSLDATRRESIYE